MKNLSLKVSVFLVISGWQVCKLKDKIYKTTVKPAMSECWAVKTNDAQKLHTTDMRMPRWAIGKTRRTTSIMKSGEKATSNQ